jgi:hypothetical protein
MSNEQVAPETKGVTVKLLATVDLGPEIEGMAGRQLRMRMVTIEPGGVFGPLVVKTSPVSVRRVGMLLLQDVVFRESGTLAVRARVDMAFVNAKSLRPSKIPPDLLEAIRAWLPAEDTAQ